VDLAILVANMIGSRALTPANRMMMAPSSENEGDGNEDFAP
jgi:hypothetical protein